MRGPRPKSLILDLLSTLRRGSMPVAALVEAASLFGIADGSLRVALSRLLAEGRVERDERGAYRLGPAAAPVQGLVSGWRDLEGRTRDWRGGWIGVQTRTASRGAGRAPARALRLLGFRPLTPDLQLRPANLRDGLDGVRMHLRALGLPAEAPVFALTGLDPEHDALARSLWDTAGLERGYAEGRERLEASRRRLPGLSEREALCESFLVGGRVLQQLVLDPLLPAPLVDTAARSGLAGAMRDYDRLGRAAWAPFLRRHGVPHFEAPAQARWAAA